MSFSDYLDDFIKQRDQKGTAAPSSNRAAFRQQQTVADATSQSIAREALAKSQEDAFTRSSIETKEDHYRVNGRCVTQNEAQAIEQLRVQPTPVNTNRIAYIQQLRKDLHLKKRS
ncbi:hypothetical protein L4D00_21695 [Photobacterium swingsii]|uniref:Uncharacterized protein n=1 Tax=Photobacterium swingsii TaxID=680026 RepID=A0A0J8VBU1_9GAMM|nr:hypothetical protein [Photobacterium swingsii]KMV30781.1 hypothetical protein AB733_09190 [Photobacterium swingsii]PSW25906.1 hypothetical protein C9I94_04885 [Photobacterium swingsii]